MSVLDAFDDEELLGIIGWDKAVPINVAARLTKVSQAQIRQWKSRGHLEAQGTDERGRPMYRGIDVLRAQATVEANTRRTQALSLATRRESVSA